MESGPARYLFFSFFLEQHVTKGETGYEGSGREGGWERGTGDKVKDYDERLLGRKESTWEGGKGLTPRTVK